MASATWINHRTEEAREAEILGYDDHGDGYTTIQSRELMYGSIRTFHLDNDGFYVCGTFLLSVDNDLTKKKVKALIARFHECVMRPVKEARAKAAEAAKLKQPRCESCSGRGFYVGYPSDTGATCQRCGGSGRDFSAPKPLDSERLSPVSSMTSWLDKSLVVDLKQAIEDIGVALDAGNVDEAKAIVREMKTVIAQG